MRWFTMVTGAYPSPCDTGVIRGRRCDTACTQATKTWVLVATTLGSSMAFIDGSVVNVALPAIQTNLNASASALQWIASAYILTLSALMLLGGAAGDVFGRKRIFVLGIAVFTAASLACGGATSASLLAIARAVQGLGGALLVPNSLALIGATFNEDERGQAIGTWAGFSAITTAFGPVLGGWAVDALSWRLAFFINLPIGLATLILTVIHLPESRAAEKSTLDWYGGAVITIGLASLSFGLIEMNEGRIARLWIVLALIVGLAGIAAFLWFETMSRAPMVPLDLFRSPAFAGANLMTLLLYFAVGGVFFFLPFNLIALHGYSAVEAGLTFLPFSIILGSASRWSGHLVDRFGARWPLIIGPAITAIGCALFVLPGHAGSYWTSFFPPMLVLGLGMTVAIAPLTTTVMAAVPEAATGLASGINNAAARIAGLLAIAFLGIAFLHVTDGAFAKRLAVAPLSPERKSEVLAAPTRFDGKLLPPNLTAADLMIIAPLNDAATLAGFRFAMILCAGCAAASALCAAATIGDRRPEVSPVSPDGH